MAAKVVVLGLTVTRCIYGASKPQDAFEKVIGFRGGAFNVAKFMDNKMLTTDLLEKPGIHEKEIYSAFKGNVVFDGAEPVFDTPLYLLAFSNRSGSNLLASHLRSTPYFAGFHEQLIHTTVRRQAQEGNCQTFPDFIRFASTRYNKNGRRWGFKASYDQIMMLYRFGIDKMYPSVKIIHMTRLNTVDQAISYLIASQTEKWTSKHEGKPDVEPAYDYGLINHLIQESMLSELHIKTIGHIFEADYHRVDYGTLTKAPANVLKKIGRFTDLDLTNWKPNLPPIQKQATDVNKAFYERYLADRKASLLQDKSKFY